MCYLSPYNLSQTFLDWIIAYFSLNKVDGLADWRCNMLISIYKQHNLQNICPLSIQI